MEQTRALALPYSPRRRFHMADTPFSTSSSSPVAHSLSDTLDDTASWLRNMNVRDMWSDVEGTIKAYPVAALIGAVVVGFAAGRLLRRG
jgi:hypothetical protein